MSHLARAEGLVYMYIAGRPARTYIQQLCEDTGCRPEDLPEAMNDREKWPGRVRDIRAAARHDDDDIYSRDDWKFHRLTKVLSLKTTKWCLFFNIVTAAVDAHLPSMFQYLDLIGQKCLQQQIWYQQMSFSACEFFSPSLHMYVFTKPYCYIIKNWFFLY